MKKTDMSSSSVISCAYLPEPFEIRCLNHAMRHCNDRFRPNLPFFFIDVMRDGGFYDLNEVWSQKDLLDFGDFEKDDVAPVVELYYPYHDPAFVRLHWWNDTYSGIVSMRAVEEPGWVKLDVKYDDFEFESESKSEDPDDVQRKRMRFVQVNDAEVDALLKATSALANRKDLMSEEEWKWLNLMALRVKFQREL